MLGFISNCIAYYGAAYIKGLTVLQIGFTGIAAIIRLLSAGEKTLKYGHMIDMYPSTRQGA